MNTIEEFFTFPIKDLLPDPSNFGGNSSIFSKINVIFSTGVVALVATISQFTYLLYRAHQFSKHNGFGLEDRFKLVKCHALLHAATDTSSTLSEPVLQQCESLLLSVKDQKYAPNKEKLLVKLLLCYARQKKQEQVYKMAQHLSTLEPLLTAVENMRQEKLKIPNEFTALLTEAFTRVEKGSSEDAKLKDFDTTLKLAKAFHFIGGSNDDYLKKALSIAETYKANKLQHVRLLSQIANYYQGLGLKEKARAFLQQAEDSLKFEMDSLDRLKVRLVLADGFFSIQYIAQMDEQISLVLGSITEDNVHEIIYPLAQLINKIKGTESKYNNYNIRALLAKPIEQLKPTDDSIEKIPPKLTDSKIDLCIQLLQISKNCQILSDEEQKKILDILRKSYENYPTETQHNSSQPGWNKRKLGDQLLRLYDEIGMTDEAVESFFEKHDMYVAGQDNRPNHIFDQINLLVTYCSPHTQAKESPINNLIKSRLDSIHSKKLASTEAKNELSTKIIGYLQIDPQRVVSLLNDYEDALAKSYKRMVAVTLATAVVFVTTSFFVAQMYDLYNSLPS